MLEPHIRALFLLCLKLESNIGGDEGGVLLGKLDLTHARDNFRRSGECVGR